MECEMVVIDGYGGDPNGEQKTQKRKRGSLVTEKLKLGKEEREAQIESLRKELDGLFGYYRQVMGEKEKVGLDPRQCRNVANAIVASLMEERDLPLSKLVDEIYSEVKKLNGAVSETLTVATVKTSVLFLGQRMMYGVPNADADVLEDESESCLWCWETRDLKLMPQSVRRVLNIRRTCRKRIHERITAVSEMIMALQKSQKDENCNDLIKASDKLGKVRKEAEIRQLVNRLMQNSGADLADKEAKREEKLLIKQLERDKREAEKEKKRLEREALKEKLQSEKEQKRLQEEAERDEKRREREELEIKKQLRKQQEEAEKDQRRREKEEAELRKQRSVQKQASIMERFLKKSKTSPLQTEQSLAKTTTTVSLSERREKMPGAVTRSMDRTLSSNEDVNVADISKLHFSSWCRLGHSIRSNRNQHWGIRKKPKAELFKELKLTATRPLVVVIDELDEEKLENGGGECVYDDRSCQTNASCSLPDVKKFVRRKQLLQFDKSYRPAFYGIWPKKSHVVGPRHPLRKDPDLDYDIDSDEEWEEEDPGESLSDCDKEDEDESLEGCSKTEDGDESEDGFFVPDGYLSENEVEWLDPWYAPKRTYIAIYSSFLAPKDHKGVQVDKMETDDTVEEAKGSAGVESEEFCALLRQQKYLNNLTEHALRKNQPLIISNLMHEKTSLLIAEDLTGTPRLEKMCLQALSMRIFPGGSPVDISLDLVEGNDQEACPSSGKGRTTPDSAVIEIPDPDLCALVSSIQSCSQGMHKLVEVLQQKFPAYSKSQLRNKVREISDFVDNRWRVKREVLNKLGLSTSPEAKSSGRTESIAAFFLKRCMPPTGKSINHPNDTSSQPSLKTSSAVEGQRSCT
ncbi:Chromatin assembly factor 1 subunit A [Parasponia andersonii]|uniref:Chromatin assembly factor 1 subunit A n=1 Tax=Parasponia andersonii TaxID=3476 RepID=A0A2P5C314_PARAD|nr:Chromatin assembly factor 1 subunit A [Parasponia andersonii]